MRISRVVAGTSGRGEGDRGNDVARDPVQKLAEMPKIMAMTTASTEASTEAAPFTPHSHGASCGREAVAKPHADREQRSEGQAHHREQRGASGDAHRRLGAANEATSHGMTKPAPARTAAAAASSCSPRRCS